MKKRVTVLIKGIFQWWFLVLMSIQYLTNRRQQSAGSQFDESKGFLISELKLRAIQEAMIRIQVNFIQFYLYSAKSQQMSSHGTSKITSDSSQ